MEETKSIKIPRQVHRELKAFIGKQEDESIGDFVGFAIVKELRERGHKFIFPKQKSKQQP